MESNDKLEELLRQMYAEETQVDLDEEWQKFEARALCPQAQVLGMDADSGTIYRCADAVWYCLCSYTLCQHSY